MIPSQPLRTDSAAEMRVFDQLRGVFSGPQWEDWFAIHSLNLPQHAYKRFAEADFIVCGPQGIYVLEVKGGGVSCHEGVWETRNRKGEVSRLRESPFRQAQGAMHGLLAKTPPELVDAFVTGYGVIMPDIQDVPESVEWDPQVLATGRRFKQFEQWFLQLIQYWRDKRANPPLATREQLDQLRQHLRPDFEAVLTLHASANEAEARIAKLTEDQLALIDAVESNDRIICSGGAGTGKTMLGLALAKRWAAAGMNVAMTCHSPWLKSFLARTSVVGLTVCLLDAMGVAARRAGVDKFDAVIVDEGQDILSMDSLTKLDAWLKGGLGAGRWCFFHDINNQSGLCGVYVSQAYEYLEKLASVQMTLTTNCRNALPILHRIKETLRADMGNPGVGAGPRVREVSVSSPEQAAEALEQELKLLTDNEGFLSGDIVILSPLSATQALISRLPERCRQSIAILDDASPLNSARQTIGFAQVADFKGLESEVIILVDLPTPGSCESLKSLHYVGMSRARSVLSVISS